MYNPRKHKTTKRTFSVYEDILDELERESIAHDSNPSALLNKILRKWFSFDSPLGKIGTITFADPCFVAMISNMDTDYLREIAREQATRNFGALLALFHGNLDIASIIDSYYENFGKYSGWYSFSCERVNNLYRLIFQHTRGLKWSQFIAEYNQVILEKVSNKIDCHVDNNVVVFSVAPKQKVIVDYH